jgi:hypothetical protein
MTTNTPPPDITEQLNKTIEQINTYIENSAEQLNCGPDCQALEKTKTLKEKYEQAKTNMESSPGEYQTAKKNYYTYIMGQSGYDVYITNNLTDQANNIEKNINTIVNNLVKEMKDLNDTYKSVSLSNSYLIKLDKKYNEEINDLEKNTGSVITNDRKTYYEKQNYDNLIGYYKFFLWVYYLLLIVFTIMLFLYNRTIGITRKIICIVLFVLYPFFSTDLFLWMIRLFYNFISLFPSNIYNKI